MIKQTILKVHTERYIIVPSKYIGKTVKIIPVEKKVKR